MPDTSEVEGGGAEWSDWLELLTPPLATPPPRSEYEENNPGAGIDGYTKVGWDVDDVSCAIRVVQKSNECRAWPRCGLLASVVMYA